MPLVSDFATGLDNHHMASHHGLLSWVFSVRMRTDIRTGALACHSNISIYKIDIAVGNKIYHFE